MNDLKGNVFQITGPIGHNFVPEGVFVFISVCLVFSQCMLISPLTDDVKEELTIFKSTSAAGVLFFLYCLVKGNKKKKINK